MHVRDIYALPDKFESGTILKLIPWASTLGIIKYYFNVIKPGRHAITVLLYMVPLTCNVALTRIFLARKHKDSIEQTHLLDE